MLSRDVRIGAAICAHNEELYIRYCLEAIYDFVDVILVNVNTGVPWGGEPEPLDRTLELVREFPDPAGKLEVTTGEWESETQQREGTMDALRPHVNYYMTLDADEIYSQADLIRLREYISRRPYIGQFRLRLKTYWKINPMYVIDPPEPMRQYVISRLRPSTRVTALRRTNEFWRATVPTEVAVMHHYSYARTDERIRQKLANTLHRFELVEDWYENVWKKWDEDHDLQDLHPTHPEEYRRAIPTDVNSMPEVMRDHPFAAPR